MQSKNPKQNANLKNIFIKGLVKSSMEKHLKNTRKRINLDLIDETDEQKHKTDNQKLHLMIKLENMKNLIHAHPMKKNYKYQTHLSEILCIGSIKNRNLSMVL